MIIGKSGIRNPKSEINPNFKYQKFSYLLFAFWAAICILLFIDTAYAGEIAIFYTGGTHAMLYPCDCPREPDGGVARRAALVEKLRAEYPASLLLDAGNFFAGGLLDEYTQNTQLDKKRTLVNLESMELAGYDAAAVGDAEFNFGKEFLLESADKSGFPFLSSNISSSKFLPALVKEVSGVKIGVIGLTLPSAAQKAGGLKFVDITAALAAQTAELRKQGAGVVVVLSSLPERENQRLAENIKGIDIIIEAEAAAGEQGLFAKTADTLILRASRQGRRLGKLVFSLKDNKLADFKVEALRLSDKIKDDPRILSVLPECFRNADCKKGGLEGVCQEPGGKKASCAFEKANKIKLTVISASMCKTCNTGDLLGALKKHFPGLEVSYLNYPGRRAKRLVKEYAIEALPAYLFGAEIEGDAKFSDFKANLEKKGEYYLLSPQVSGMTYFIGRKEEKGRLDLFLSLFDKESGKVLDGAREFNPEVHFLAVEQEGKFDAASGEPEAEEYLRAACLKHYYPQKFWDYITCRSADIGSSWWEDCAFGIDAAKIKTCAQGAQGRKLLSDNIGINKEIQVLYGPVYMLNNKEVFSSKGPLSKEELERVIKKR